MCTSKLYPSEKTFNHVSNGLGLTPTICKECQKMAFPLQTAAVCVFKGGPGRSL